MRVSRMVRQLVSGCRENIHAKRLQALPKIVEGIVAGGRLVPASIGKHLPGSAKPKHAIKCVDRFLGNPQVYRELLYLFCAIAHHLLHRCVRPVILVDWTQVAGSHVALVAAVPIGGRALPIYIEVHKLKKLSNAAVEERFLRSLAAILPPIGRPVVVTDAGFKGPFFQAVLSLGWDFLGRIRGTAKATPADGGPAISKDGFYSRASIRASELGRYGLFVRRPVACRLVLVRNRRRPGPKLPPPKNKEERELRKAALDPWLLATSVDEGDADYIVQLYAKRMQIEETFRDAKNHRFGWSLGDVRTASVKRAAVLLLLAALALLVMTLIGLTAERRGIHRAYQANTVARRVLSLFVLACTILRRGDDSGMTPEHFRASLAFISKAAGA